MQNIHMLKIWFDAMLWVHHILQKKMLKIFLLQKLYFCESVKT